METLLWCELRQQGYQIKRGIKRRDYKKCTDYVMDECNYILGQILKTNAENTPLTLINDFKTLFKNFIGPVSEKDNLFEIKNAEIYYL